MSCTECAPIKERSDKLEEKLQTALSGMYGLGIAISLSDLNARLHGVMVSVSEVVALSNEK